MITTRNRDRVGPIDRFVVRLRQWRENSRLLRELSEMPDAERGRLHHDLGVTHGQLDRVVTGADAAERLLPQMMERYGVDPDGVASRHRAVMRDLQRTCAGCPFQRKCRRALARGANRAECRRFCMNNATLATLARGAGARH